MKHFLPFKTWNVTQVASNFLICQTELFQNSFLPFTIIEWNKLVLDVRNVETYLLFRNNLLAFIWPIKNFINSIYDPLGIKLLHKLRQGFSHLWENTFRHSLADTVNPLSSCYLETESIEYYIMRCHNYTTFRTILINKLNSINSKFNTLELDELIRTIHYANENFDNGHQFLYFLKTKSTRKTTIKSQGKDT